VSLFRQEAAGSARRHQEQDRNGKCQMHEDQTGADNGVESNGASEVDAGRDEDDDSVGDECPDRDAEGRSSR